MSIRGLTACGVTCSSVNAFLGQKATPQERVRPNELKVIGADDVSGNLFQAIGRSVFGTGSEDVSDLLEHMVVLADRLVLLVKVEPQLIIDFLTRSRRLKYILL